MVLNEFEINGSTEPRTKMMSTYAENERDRPIEIETDYACGRRESCRLRKVNLRCIRALQRDDHHCQVLQ